jgi:hypothetical protein
MKVALIEISGSHAECLPAQVIMLNEAGHEIHLVYDSKLNGIDELRPHVKEAHEVSSDLSPKQKVTRCLTYLKNGRFDLMLFNTAQGGLMKKMCWRGLPKGRKIGLLHNVNKLRKLGSQRFINMKLDGYLVLSEYLKREALMARPRLNVEWFYPSFFYPVEQAVEKPTEEKWIGIPGQVELKRRDYESLMSALEADLPPSHWRFLLLGPSDHASGDGNWVRERLKENGLEKHFVMFEGHLDHREFHAYLKQCDVILPLNHRVNGKTDYLKDQISGAWNLAYAYAKPLLLPTEYNHLEDFKGSAHFYKKDALTKRMESVLSGQSDVQALRRHSYEFHKERYLKFVGA